MEVEAGSKLELVVEVMVEAEKDSVEEVTEVVEKD